MRVTVRLEAKRKGKRRTSAEIGILHRGSRNRLYSTRGWAFRVYDFAEPARYKKAVHR